MTQIKKKRMREIKYERPERTEIRRDREKRGIEIEKEKEEEERDRNP